MKQSYILGIIFSMLFLSCGKTPEEQINAIQDDHSLNQVDKIKAITEIAGECEVCGNLTYQVLPEIKGGYFIDAYYSDSLFQFSNSTELNATIPPALSQSMWKLFYSTQELEVTAVKTTYFALVNSKMQEIYDGYIYRNEADKITNLYEVNPFKNQDNNTYIEESEQAAINKKLTKIITYDVNKSTAIQFDPPE